MAQIISNTAVPRYYAEFRNAVIHGDIPICREIGMEMNRIDDLIANPSVYYDDMAVEGWINFCENELTLTDGSDMHLLDSFKLWGEQVFGWYYFVERSVYKPYKDGHGSRYVTKRIKKRLVNKQYIIVARGGAKSMYASTMQNYFLNIDPSTTHQITTAPTMKQAEEVLSPIKTAIARSRGPLFRFLTEGSVRNTAGLLWRGLSWLRQSRVSRISLVLYMLKNFESFHIFVTNLKINLCIGLHMLRIARLCKAD